MKLSWRLSLDPDTQGYKIFRAEPGVATFSLLSGADPITGTEYIDTNPPDSAQYMVRAYGLKDVYAGSFRALSQGAFAHDTPVSETEIDISAPTWEYVPLPDAFNDTASGMIHAIIAPPAQGHLTQSDTGWLYTPPTGFKGNVDLEFSVFDRGQSNKGILRINVAP